MARREWLLNGATTLCAICTVMVTGVVIRREFFPRRPQVAKPISIDKAEWRNLLSSGHRIGPEKAALTIVEFGDFECPACGAFAKTVARFRKAHPREFAVVFHHYPLDYHDNAMKFAHASECAAEQSDFELFHDAVYAGQRRLGTSRPLDFAIAAGVADTLKFNSCMSDTTRARPIFQDLETARRIGASGTPTIVVEGKLLRQLVDSALLQGFLDERRRELRRNEY